MRLKYRKTYYLKAKTITTDSEGGKYPGYSLPVEVDANIYPASGKLQAEIYGERLNNIQNMLYDGAVNKTLKDSVVHYVSSDGKIDFCEGYGMCVNVPAEHDPDYRIISIKQYGHLVMEIEKI